MAQAEYKISDILRLVREGLDYDPKKGPGVDAANKRNNDKAYKDAEKRAKEADAGVRGTKNANKPVTHTTDNFEDDMNKTTLDVELDYDPGDEYKNRVRAQAEGYNSELEKKSGEDRAADFEGAEKTYDRLRARHDKQAAVKQKAKESGLAARTFPSDTFKKQSVFAENEQPSKKTQKMKRLNFKHACFVNEEYMLSRVPDEYKVDGNKFIMRDANHDEYMVEWKVDKNTKAADPQVTKLLNEEKEKKSLDRIQELFGYRHDSGRTTVAERKNTGKDFRDMLDRARGLVTENRE